MTCRVCSRSLAVAVALSVAVSGFLVAAPPDRDVPSAKSQLAKAYKNLLKTKTYAVDTNVLGGLSSSTDHKVVTTTVSESYGGSVLAAARAPIMHIPAIDAYKMPKAGQGVISSSGRWVRILSTPTGVKMDRLIDFPNLILAEAMRYARSARWLEEDELGDYFKSTEADDIVDFDELDDFEDLDLEDSDEDEDAHKGKTIVKESPKEEESTEKMPRVLRVTADPTQALNIWVKRVENSGCMKEG